MSFQSKIVCALENMDTRFTSLSRLKFDEIDANSQEELKEQKVQERPFAYEFYHMIRKDFDDNQNEKVVIQAEVNKTYQLILNLGKIPDFIIHIPSSKENYAVIEFKMATRPEEFKKDFDKLALFKKELFYEELYEVIIGDINDITKAKAKINNLESRDKSDYPQICVIYYDFNSGKTEAQYITRY